MQGLGHKQKGEEGKTVRGNQPLDILNRSGQEALFTNILNSEHTRISETVINFGLREGTFNIFLSRGIDATACISLGKGNDIIQIVLPNMSCSRDYTQQTIIL